MLETIGLTLASVGVAGVGVIVLAALVIGALGGLFLSALE